MVEGFFDEIPDSRQDWKVLHSIDEILTVVMCGVSAGGNTIHGIYAFAEISEIIQFQGKTILITLDCLILPFKTHEKVNWNKATSSEQVIALFGLPDKIETYSFKWPDKKSKNGLYYNPEINHPVSREHWRYAKYPDLVIDISEGHKIRRFGTFRDFNFYNQVMTSN